MHAANNISTILKYTNAYDEVLPYLYLGSLKAFEKNKFQNIDNNDNGISNENKSFNMIVNLIKQTALSDNTIPPCELFIRLPVHDSPDECETLLSLVYETRVLEQMHDFIMKERTILVHCFAGMQRSCALVACYLIKYHHMKPDEAIEYIKLKRPIAFFGQINFMRMITMFYENMKQYETI
jgi:protein-tyrosine phosphatase